MRYSFILLIVLMLSGCIMTSECKSQFEDNAKWLMAKCNGR
jgi:PBP1b-binding outer membrane lipoprotein LpoB